MTDQNANNVPTWGDKLATLRRYYDGFKPGDGYDARKLTPARKAAITRKLKAHEAFERQVMSEPGVQWLPTRAKKKESVEKLRAMGPGAAVGYPKGFRGWVAVQSPGGAEGITLTRSGAVQVLGPQGVRMVFERYDPKDMARDPMAVARDMARRHPKADGVAVRAGEYGWAKRDVNLAFEPHPGMIEAMLSRVLYRYGANIPDEDGPRADEDWGKEDKVDLRPRAKGSNYYKNWVTGLVAFYFPPASENTITDFAKYVASVEEQRRMAKKRAKNRAKRQRTSKDA